MEKPEILLESRIFRIERLRPTSKNGKPLIRDIIRHPGAVVVLPILDDDRVVLIRNTRIAVESRLLELPAGTLEVGEPPIDCARRELIEETGYRCERIEPLTAFFSSPGMLDERMYVFLATGLTEGKMALEEGEEIEVEIFKIDDAMKMVKEGRIEDGKTVASILYYHTFCRNR